MLFCHLADTSMRSVMLWSISRGKGDFVSSGKGEACCSSFGAYFLCSLLLSLSLSAKPNKTERLAFSGALHKDPFLGSFVGLASFKYFNFFNPKNNVLQRNTSLTRLS